MRSWIVGVLIVLAILSPTAEASHWLVYNTLAPGATGEDDGVSITAPGNPFDGRQNRVVRVGAVAGDGGLFFDSIIVTRAGAFDAPGSAIGTAVVGRPNTIFPGLVSPSAWYGWWDDFDQDSLIDDVHDAECEGACATDEFRWRGLATGETLAVTAFLIGPSPTGFTGFGAVNMTHIRPLRLEDRTQRERPEQEWAGATGPNDAIPLFDASTLSTVQFFSVAGAPATDGPTWYDLTHPDGLHDADRYESVNPDAEALYRSLTPTANSLVREIGERIPPVCADIRGSIDENEACVRSHVEPATGPLPGRPVPPPIPPLPPLGPLPSLPPTDPAGLQRHVAQTLATPYPKEPNHLEDDFEGRAEFGGVGDALGSFNSYPAYAAGFRFWADPIVKVRACTDARQPVGPTSVVGSTTCLPIGLSGFTTDMPDPLARSQGRNRSAWGNLFVDARPIAWHDINRDAHVGSVCDPDRSNPNVPDTFDAERNTCTNAPYPYPMTDAGGAPELTFLCQSTVRADVVLTPLTALWPNVIVVRDAWTPVAAMMAVPELRRDAEPIRLRWGEACENLGSRLVTRDSILFPMGSTVPIRMETTLTMPAFADAGKGIFIENESVTDVDVLAASL